VVIGDGVSVSATPEPGQDVQLLETNVDDATGEVIVKLVNAASTPLDCDVKLSGATVADKSARAIVLGGADKNSVNSFLDPDAIAPVENTIRASATIRRSLPASSMTVLRIKVK